MARSHQLILILGRTTAREKVGAFLLRIMQRATNDDSDRLVLPTSRYDIADYLALSVETVSRGTSEAMNTKNTTEMIPFKVKKAAFILRMSFGETIRCS